ncbi:MAG: hypothetical protein KDE27_28880 [Planctomycetes bacterium]|nr:hypothetical protein [Planctomycetota bacterium]
MMNRHLPLASVAVAAIAAFLPAQSGGATPPAPAAPAKTQGPPDSAQSPQPQAPVAPRGAPELPPNSWFPVTEIDLGTFFGSQEAVGTFKFENPHEQEIVWRGLQGSCTCSKAIIRVGDRTYELSSKPKPNVLERINKTGDGPEREVVRQIAIGPHEKGEVEVHLEIPNVPGPRQAHLDVHTTDDSLSQFKLRWHAQSAKLFVISPSEVNLNKMTWNEEREFNVTVTSPLHPDFNITGLEPPGDAFDVKYEKKVENGHATWTIAGKYGPVGTDVGGGGVLKFNTDVRGSTPFSVRVMAIVQGPLEVKPGGFVPLGMIRRGTEMKKEVIFEPNDGMKIEAEKLTLEKLTIAEEFVHVNTHNDGNKLVVEISVDEKAPAGLLKGDLVVDLNHPVVKQKRIMFNGFVR